MKIKIFSKSSQLKNPDFLENVIVPNQTHSNNIVEIISGKEDLTDCTLKGVAADGIFTSRKNNFKLGIKTADCSAIVFYDENNYGIIHAGWRGLVNGIIEKMLEKFDNPEIFVVPFLKKFEIQKDFCYDLIYEKFGDNFFEIQQEKIIFNFENALKSILGEKAVFDKRDTLEDKDFYSYRRNKTEKRNYTVIENK